jgi:hypothetical protein
MCGQIGMADLWCDVATVACAELAAQDETKADAARSALARSDFPFDLAELVREKFAVPASAARIQAATPGTGS